MKNIKTYIEFINEDLIPGGLASGMSLEDIARHHDPKGYYDIANIMPSLRKSLEDGIKIELEHTSSREIAREIAMDHLYEDPSYYKKLSAIENDVNEMIKHQGGRWLVFTKDGKKLLGSHETRKEARAQLAAIEISKHKG